MADLKVSELGELLTPPTTLDSLLVLDVSDTTQGPSGTVKRLDPSLVQTSGWADYRDGLYTELAPFQINQGETLALPNDGQASTISTFLPEGMVAMYDPVTGKFTPENVGDYYALTARFSAKSSNVSGTFDWSIDIGLPNAIFPETRVFAKGANTEQQFTITSNGFTLGSFVANGGFPQITSLVGNTAIYDIEYQIVRLHKAIT